MLNDDYVTVEIGKAKHIALVAHDGKKKELVEWCCLLYTSKMHREVKEKV